MSYLRRLLLLAFSLILIAVNLAACGKGSNSSASTPVVVVNVTPSPGKAVVKGVFIESATRKAPIEGSLYLGSITSMSTGDPIVRLDRGVDPSTSPAPNGDFVFKDIEPGKYALIFYLPEINFLVDKPGSGESLIFDVAADQVLDLGKITVTMPTE